jgi:hypothetical protein
MPPNLGAQKESHLANNLNQPYEPPFRLFENQVGVSNEAVRQAPQQAAQYYQYFAVLEVDIKQYEKQVLSLHSCDRVSFGVI